jgi:drug/metabolite transporter (DMT)-like permease
MIAYLFGLISYVGWGAGDVFGTFATRKIGAIRTTFWIYLIGSCIGGLYIPFALKELSAITPTLLCINIFLGILYVVGNLTYSEALCFSSAPIVGTIGGSYAAVTIILSYIFLHEHISMPQILLIMVVFLGVGITSTSHNQKKDKHFTKGVMLSLFSLVSWGIYFTFSKVLMRSMGWFWPNYIPLLMFPLIGIYAKWKQMPIKLHSPSANIALVCSTLLLRGGDFAYNIGASLGLTATVAPIGGAYPTLFAVLSYFVFHDPLNRKQVAGICIALLGLVALGFI